MRKHQISFPLEGGRAGMGVLAPPYPGGRGRRIASNDGLEASAGHTPTQPSPLEKEGSWT
jgi:hypothetical protein